MKISDLSRRLDNTDPLRKFRSEFHIPVQNDGEPFLYLCGNSLGLQPRKAREYVDDELKDWARLGVEGHTDAKHPWLPYHEFLTENMATIAGALESEVVVMNSLTVNLHLLLVSFYRPTDERYKIIIEENAFPSDIYTVKSQIKFHGYNPDDALLVIPCSEGKSYTEKEDILDFIDRHGEETTTILIGGVNYYSGQVMPVEEITTLGHQKGCKVGFDMAHGAGNIEMKLHERDVDFATWCSYKYLNSGPGSLAGVYIHERYHDVEIPRFEGWWGHNKVERFEMPDEFHPIATAEAWQLSNPPILPMACMRASLEIFAEAKMSEIRKKSMTMMEHAENCFSDIDSDEIAFITPNETEMRGCQLSIQVKNGDKTVFNKLQEKGVIADWRKPDVIRIAFVPLYNSYKDVEMFSQFLKEAMQ